MKLEKKAPDWAGMPHELIEKIIGHAIDADVIDRRREGELSNWEINFGLDFREGRIGRYARVCRGWKAAIFGATRSFKRKYIDGLYVDRNNKCDFFGKPEQMIKEGFLSVIRQLKFNKTSTLPREICDFAHENSIKEFIGVPLNQQSSDDGHKLITLMYLSKKAQSFEIEGEVKNQNDAELLWKLLRAMVHCNRRPKRIRCEILFTYKPDWSFDDADAGNLKGRIEKLDLSTCQFRYEVPPVIIKVPAIIEAPDWSALAHFIEYVEINPTIIDFVTTIKAKTLRVVEWALFECHPARKFTGIILMRNYYNV